LPRDAGDKPQPTDPFLTYTSDFRHDETGVTVAVHDPAHRYYFACVRCGTPLDRSEKGFCGIIGARNEASAALVVSHFTICDCGNEVSQIVAEWTRGGRPGGDGDILCDRKAMPESTAQKLTVEILERARRVGSQVRGVRCQVECRSPTW